MSDDVERLIAARKPAMAFTLGGMGSAKTNFYNDAYCRAGYEDDAKAVQSLWIDGKRDQAVARVPDEMVLLTNLIGTEDMIRERLKAFRDASVNTFRLGTGASAGKSARRHWKKRSISYNAKPQAGRSIFQQLVHLRIFEGDSHATWNHFLQRL